MGHMAGLLNFEDTAFVALNRTYPQLVKDFQGPIMAVAGDRGGQGEIGRFWQDKGELSLGPSVAQMCFSLAMKIKADPICLVGQDLSWVKTTHMEGVDFAEKINH